MILCCTECVSVFQCFAVIAEYFLKSLYHTALVCQFIIFVLVWMAVEFFIEKTMLKNVDRLCGSFNFRIVARLQLVATLGEREIIAVVFLVYDTRYIL